MHNTQTITIEQQHALEQAARAAVSHSYAPYSRFPVGAAVLAADGSLFAGCNVENASYGLAICAERVAVVRAVASGYRHIAAVCVYTPTPTATPPCGACRQVLSEFCPDTGMLVVSVCESTHRIETTLDALLPGAFRLSPDPDGQQQ